LKKLYPVILAILSLQYSALAEDLCKGKSANKILHNLQLKKTDIKDSIERTAQLIHVLNDQEKVLNKHYKISSTISYSLIGAGLAGLTAGGVVTILSGGEATLSLGLGRYAAGESIGIGGSMLKGAAVVGGARAYVVFGDKASCFNADALRFNYREGKPKLFDVFGDDFKSARHQLMALQKKLEESKGAKSFFNWNGKRELTKNQIRAVTNFHMLKLLTLELETIKASMKYLLANCDSDKVFLEFDTKSEASKIIDEYRSLDKMDEIKLESDEPNVITTCPTENTPKEAINSSEEKSKEFPASGNKRRVFLEVGSTPQ
jgi:hypothetical protein